MSANSGLFHSETYVQQAKTIEKPVFHIWAKMLFIGLFESFHPYLCKTRKQSDKNIFGGSWGAHTSIPRLPNFQGSMTSSQSRHMYNKGKQ